jgi:hypothetical protein
MYLSKIYHASPIISLCINYLLPVYLSSAYLPHICIVYLSIIHLSIYLSSIFYGSRLFYLLVLRKDSLFGCFVAELLKFECASAYPNDLVKKKQPHPKPGAEVLIHLISDRPENLYFVFFGGGVPGLELRAYTLSHCTSPFCVRYFQGRVS